MHGDWGRTEPNVSELLGCQAAIIQLDVAGLHDDLPGADPSVNTSADPSMVEVCDEDYNYRHGQ